jgi:DNA replication protein DnaC
MQKLLSYFKELKLAGIASCLEERISYAKQNKLSYQEFLELLCEDERDNRRDNNYKKRRSASKIPCNKRLEEFDFNYQPSIDRNEIYELGMCKFIKSNENIVLVGDSGTGKTHLGISLGLKALEKEYKVYFTTVSDMLYNLHISKADNSYHKRLQQLISYDLLILDELGFKKLPKYSSDDFYNVISKRYENKSTIITTNKEIENWNDIFEEEVLTRAIIDRIMHHVHIFNIKGKSYRTKRLKSEGKMG